MRILFVADVVGRPGREAVERLVPGLRDELELDLVVSTARTSPTGGASPRASATRCSPPGPTPSRSATTRSPAAGSGVPRARAAHRAPRQPAREHSGARLVRRARAGRHRRGGRSTCSALRYLEPARSPFEVARVADRRGRRARARDRRRHARRGDEREGRDGPPPRRARDRRPRHAHAHPDERPVAAARRHRLPDGCRA